MSSPVDTLSQTANSKSSLLIKILAVIIALVGLVCMWLVSAQVGFTPIAILAIVAILLLALLCCWRFKGLNGNLDGRTNDGNQSEIHLQQVQNPANLLSNTNNSHQNPLFKPLALLSLAGKQQLLETPINPQQLIETKQTFEQCCAWQFSHPDSFDGVDLCENVEQLLSLNLLTGKANYKSGLDKQNIDTIWQQWLSKNDGQPCECRYEVLDDKGQPQQVIETWLLIQGQQTKDQALIWYRAIGLVSAQAMQNGSKTDVKSAEQMRVEKEKMQALVCFADGITHDYNNLFGIVNGYTELMTGVLDDRSKLSEYIEYIQSASDRAEELGNQILALSRRRKSGMALVDFEQIMIEPLFIFKKNLPDTVKFDWILGKTHHQINLDPSKLEEILFAIGENAITAMDAKGTLRIVSQVVALSEQKAQSIELVAGDYLCFSIIDNGCGMDDEQLKRALEPYYSTTGGSGFGLCGVYGFMKTCDGAVGIDSSLGQGTRVSLYFPLVTDGG